MEKKEITKDTTLAEILKLPEANKILAKYNLPCLDCPAASFEVDQLKIGDVCQMYNINLKKLLEELNKTSQ
jgi:hybrid cluster-associated redox disulfide protein